MQHLTLSLRDLAITVDLPFHLDPFNRPGVVHHGGVDALAQDLADDIINAVGQLLTARFECDVTVSVVQPPAPKVGLVEAFHTEPF